MPNNCWHTFSISGPTKTVNGFVAAVKHPNQGIIPSLLPLDEGEGTTIDQHDAWGTKWGDCDTTFDVHHHDDGFSDILGTFWTPWGPADLAWRKISELYPDLLFSMTFQEYGMGFAGAAVYCDGLHQISEFDIDTIASQYDAKDDPFECGLYDQVDEACSDLLIELTQLVEQTERPTA